ncbi:NUDIX hydrolase [Vagococcus humatus]|uniref:NUDIX hydrolase n=1 Tax=Vagococcus humatus TaxID=1889241 RepID=A0A429Z690_9ENTE|nr:NUDIX hydrolase [Vagococcus humatus]RST89206.1 NUDIX hydrolase [Vagococcus humatus]
MSTSLITEITQYQTVNEQEERDKALILAELTNNPQVFLRESSLAHMTASAWVVNEDKTKVLMVYHHIYNSWSWLGGHADGEEDLLKVAIKEVKEESGLKQVSPVSTNIFSLEVLTVDGHIKHGQYVSSHLHLNVTYLLEAKEKDKLVIKPDENSGVAWFPLEKAVEASTEPWFQKHVYQKLNAKLVERNKR